ncbi:IclR family transcriptional regulator domain-containing protein [Mycobacterium kyogaense]|uniref:IclR family transcriptional regulator domain-containing protein n=1 Tax=Mycobacterium kyogaense TaxID=2212479 RepID=UPI001968BDA8|nr:IclR family transcriptional regulator C-terminal domain-containing protein [Mycobacterium kyogaense]
MTKPPEDRDIVRALTRGLDVILAFSNRRSRMSLTQVAAGAALSKPTARRLLLTLQQAGYVESDGKTFSLTPKILGLGYAYLSSLNLTEIAQPHMEKVAEATGHGCSLSVLDGSEVVYISRVPTHRIANLTLATGSRLPAHATSMGHVLLAGLGAASLRTYLEAASLIRVTARTIVTAEKLADRLAQVRQQGWAIVDQELEDGIRSASAPVVDAHGHVIAALGMSTTTDTAMTTIRDTYVPALKQAAANISSELGSGALARPS